MSLPKYILNFDELAKLLDNKLNISGEADTSKLEELLKKYFDELLDLLRRLLGLDLIQKSISFQHYIPALNFDFEIKHTFDTDILITGITYSQTGWKVSDCWSLYINNNLLFDKIYTKELGEHKVFNAFYPAKKGELIQIIHHNISGNSKQVWYDIDFLEIQQNENEDENEEE